MRLHAHAGVNMCTAVFAGPLCFAMSASASLHACRCYTALMLWSQIYDVSVGANPVADTLCSLMMGHPLAADVTMVTLVFQVRPSLIASMRNRCSLPTVIQPCLRSLQRLQVHQARSAGQQGIWLMNLVYRSAAPGRDWTGGEPGAGDGGGPACCGPGFVGRLGRHPVRPQQLGACADDEACKSLHQLATAQSPLWALPCGANVNLYAAQADPAVAHSVTPPAAAVPTLAGLAEWSYRLSGR